jgi:hypothetical protein
MCCSCMKTSIRTAVAIANHGPTSNNPNPSSDPGSIQVFHHVHDTRLSSLAALLWRGCVVQRCRRRGRDVARSRKGGATHKSLKGNNLAMPPRTTNTATAKFTMRLLSVSLVPRNCNGTARQQQQPSAESARRRASLASNSQDIREVHVGA